MTAPAPTLPRRLFGTAFDTRAAWTIDACLLPPAGAPGTAAGSGDTGGDGAGSGANGPRLGGGVLFLDIVKEGQEAWQGDPADRDRFTRWGYA